MYCSMYCIVLHVTVFLTIVVYDNRYITNKIESNTSFYYLPSIYLYNVMKIITHEWIVIADNTFIMFCIITPAPMHNLSTLKYALMDSPKP